MRKLVCLELKRNNMKGYAVASCISCAVLLMFIYFVSYVAQVESGVHEMQFQNYTNIFRFTGTISLIIFSIMSAVMYAHFVIEEYSGKKAALLFSYPVSRKKILLAKLLLVFAFTSLSMLICTVIPYLVFGLTESVAPIVAQDTMTAELLTDTIKILAVAVFAVGGIGIAAMRVGFIKKSVPATLITAFLLSVTYGNAALSTNTLLSGFAMSGVGLVAAIVIIIGITGQVDRMEVQ